MRTVWAIRVDLYLFQQLLSYCYGGIYLSLRLRSDMH